MKVPGWSIYGKLRRIRMLDIKIYVGKAVVLSYGRQSAARDHVQQCDFLVTMLHATVLKKQNFLSSGMIISSTCFYFRTGHLEILFTWEEHCLLRTRDFTVYLDVENHITDVSNIVFLVKYSGGSM